MGYLDKDKIIDFYIDLCKVSFKDSYYGWQRDVGANVKKTISAFPSQNGFVPRIVKICMETTGMWLEKRSLTERLYDWPKDNEAELRIKISTALQSN